MHECRVWECVPSLNLDFALPGPRHQLLDRFARTFAIVQDGVHLFGDWHLYAARMRQSNRGRRREYSFCDHAVHSSDDIGEFLAAPEFYTNAAVARESPGAGENEVAKSGESGHGFRAPATSDDQACHLGKTASDERSYRIVAQAEPVANAGSDRNDVLERTTELDSDDIGIGVDAKALVTELLLDGAQQCCVRRSNGDGSRISAGDFLRKRLPTESSDWRFMVVENL